MTPTVRVVTYGFPPQTHAILDRPSLFAEMPKREVLADSLASIEEGVRVAESKLAERGMRAGEWTPIGPLVREAVVVVGGA